MRIAAPLFFLAACGSHPICTDDPAAQEGACGVIVPQDLEHGSASSSWTADVNGYRADVAPLTVFDAIVESTGASTEEPGQAQGCDGLSVQDAGGRETCLVLEEHEIVVVPKALDVLFVISNTYSMYTELDRLATASSTLLDHLGDLSDIHLGVITTDMDDPSHSGLLQSAYDIPWMDGTYTDDEIDSWLSAALKQSMMVYPGARGLDAIHTALESSHREPGFYREDARLAIVAATDWSDSSDIRVVDFEAWLFGLKPSPGLLSFHAYASPPQDCGLGWLRSSSEYNHLVRVTAGHFWPICEGDITDEMIELGESLNIDGYNTTGSITLDGLPEPATLTVALTEPDGTTIVLDEQDYNLVLDTIHFVGFTPLSGSLASIAYEPMTGSLHTASVVSP